MDAARERPLAQRQQAQRRAWMVKRSENVNLGGLWLEGHGLSVGSEALGLSFRVNRAGASLQTQSVEPVVVSCGLTKTATLTMLPRKVAA